MSTGQDDNDSRECDRSVPWRGRQFWFWIGMVPGFLVLPAFWRRNLFFSSSGSGVDPAFYTVAALFWIGGSAIKLASLKSGRDAPEALAAGAGWFFLLILLNAALGIALIFGSCMLVR